MVFHPTRFESWSFSLTINSQTDFITGGGKRKCKNLCFLPLFLSLEKNCMPVISMFYGIIIRMFYFDNKEHKTPHIHIEFAEFNAVVEIPGGSMLAGDFPKDKFKLVLAWIEIHKDELMADWKLAVDGQQVFKIEALK